MNLIIKLPIINDLNYFVATKQNNSFFLCENYCDYGSIITFPLPLKHNNFFFMGRDYKVSSVSVNYNSLEISDKKARVAYPFMTFIDLGVTPKNELIEELRSCIRKCKNASIPLNEIGSIFNLECIENIMFT